MKPLKDARLRTLLSLIEGGVTLADVGTDHGKLPVAALLSGRASAAIAIDVSEASLAKARALAAEEGVRMRSIHGDGLTPLKAGEADVVVIAGIGAAETIKILEEAPCTFPRYLFVPHKNAPLLRRYLKEKNARIIRDIAVKEGKHFYFVIEADFSLPWQEHSVYFGTEGEALAEYRTHRLQRLSELIALGGDPSLAEEKEELIHAETH
ncbi:MAG: SAM-dependent methyltransferase [Clostridia bacterium]|nr:SAM-dependent methyltransferase [Clostridia bacterium]